MEIIVMRSNSLKSFLILAACAAGLWKMAAWWWGPAVKPGEVTLLTASNFHDVRREAGTLVALYMSPG
jgi:hypothetical protein